MLGIFLEFITVDEAASVRLETLFAEASRKHLPRKSSRKDPWKQDILEVPTSRKEGLLFLKKSVRNVNTTANNNGFRIIPGETAIQVIRALTFFAVPLSWKSLRAHRDVHSLLLQRYSSGNRFGIYP